MYMEHALEMTVAAVVGGISVVADGDAAFAVADNIALLMKEDQSSFGRLSSLNYSRIADM
jgi:hypothetical protein